jgi:23S rRNA (pseudouridine1915-N3)-methyltransferase
MHVRVIAVGTRMPSWVGQGVAEYVGRLKPSFRVTFTEIEPGARPAGAPVTRAVADESRRVAAALKSSEFAVALDEKGRELTSLELARWLGQRMQSGENLAFCIGGPDGHAPALLESCRMRLALSRLTFPHALARLILVEQLYRAQCVLANHPYHRE